MDAISKGAIFLIDGSAMLYRSFYGLSSLRTSKGIPTQAIYGFFRFVKRLISAYGACKIVIAWDESASLRREEYPKYKATRMSPPDELLLQKKYIGKIAKKMGLCQVSQSGYEADDLIATLALKHSKSGSVVLVASDKDLFQLISENVVVLDPSKNQMLDLEGFKKKYGFSPSKLAFFHALAGDSSDNIPGVRGIGKKGAFDLVTSFKDLGDLFKRLDEVKSARTRKLLEVGKDDALLSFKLFTLRTYPLKLKASQIKFSEDMWSNADSLFEELEMPTLMSSKGMQTSKEKICNKVASFKYEVIVDEKVLRDLVNKNLKKKVCVLDVETTDLDWCRGELVGISLAFDDKTGYYIPIGNVGELVESQVSVFSVDNAQERRISIEKVAACLKPLLISKVVEKVMHNAKFDLHFLRESGIDVKGKIFDTMIAARLLLPEWQKVGLKILSKQVLNEEMTDFKDVAKGYAHFGQIPVEKAAKYAVHDVLQTFKLMKKFKNDLRKHKKLESLFEDVEMPLCRVLLEMESRGIALDPDVLRDVEKRTSKKLSTIEGKIRSAISVVKKKTSEEINLNSPKQVQILLFDVLKLPEAGKKRGGKGARSTDRDALLELSKTHPIPGLILKFRELSKIQSTYLRPLPRSICPRTGRVHTNYSQARVATGRLASSDPNLQNIPVGGDGEGDVRSAFVAGRGNVLMSADYSQIELRVLAHLSGDKELIAAYSGAEDLHLKTAAQIFGVEAKKVNVEQRQIGKRINFSVLYGMTAFTLSRELGISVKDAKSYMERFFERYPAVEPWMEKVIQGAKRNGYAETWLGRRRYVPGINDSNRTVFEAARRVIVNFGPQGTAAEIIKLAMIKLEASLARKYDSSKILLQVHDELILEVKKTELKEVEALVRHSMESVVKWEVPLVVSIKSGRNWGEITK